MKPSIVYFLLCFMKNGFQEKLLWKWNNTGKMMLKRRCVGMAIELGHVCCLLHFEFYYFCCFIFILSFWTFMRRFLIERKYWDDQKTLKKNNNNTTLAYFFPCSPLTAFFLLLCWANLMCVGQDLHITGVERVREWKKVKKKEKGRINKYRSKRSTKINDNIEVKEREKLWHCWKR